MISNRHDRQISAMAVYTGDLLQMRFHGILFLRLSESFWVYGLAGEADGDITQTDLRGKIVLVVGNEGKGLSRLVRENCDGLIKIPMLGKINSLNASVASAIAIYESLRQNGFN